MDVSLVHALARCTINSWAELLDLFGSAQLSH